jgi:hypothetical protein
MPKKLLVFIIIFVLAFVLVLIRLSQNINDLKKVVEEHETIVNLPTTGKASPSPVFTPTLSPTSAPISNIKYLKYQSPENWFRVTDSLATFELRFDSSKFKIAFVSDHRIDLKLANGLSGPSINLFPYNGGSRHSFLKSNYSCTIIPETKEYEYNISGKSGLILTGVDCSATYLVGVVVANKSSAWGVSSTGDLSSDFESVISTLKLL